MSELNIEPPRREAGFTDRGGEHDLRAAIYARTSSPSRAYGYSLDRQVEACIQRCKARGWSVEYIFRDENESGADQDRPMFQEMMTKGENEEIDVVVFWKLDRFSRSLIHAVELEERFRELDIALHSVTEQLDTTTATGRFNFRNLANAAEFEREMIVQRTQMSMHALATQHKWPNDTPPLGYGLDEDGRLQMDVKEAVLVRSIFSMYTEHKSMPTVAQRLNDEDCVTKEGNDWTARAVGDILRNEIYTGQYSVADVNEYVPEYQIISEDLFDTVRDIRYRFQRGEGARPPMEEERKAANVEEVIEQYIAYVENE